jgi:hypothetical protein
MMSPEERLLEDIATQKHLNTDVERSHSAVEEMRGSVKMACIVSVRQLFS